MKTYEGFLSNLFTPSVDDDKMINLIKTFYGSGENIKVSAEWSPVDRVNVMSNLEYCKKDSNDFIKINLTKESVSYSIFKNNDVNTNYSIDILINKFPRQYHSTKGFDTIDKLINFLFSCGRIGYNVDRILYSKCKEILSGNCKEYDTIKHILTKRVRDEFQPIIDAIKIGII